RIGMKINIVKSLMGTMNLSILIVIQNAGY
ncbi:uncharacterized protein METZ01_LOCUS95084, partial [marine metagenome]